MQNLLNSLKTFLGSVPNGLNTIANSLFYFFRLIIVLKKLGSKKYLLSANILFSESFSFRSYVKFFVLISSSLKFPNSSYLSFNSSITALGNDCIIKKISYNHFEYTIIFRFQFHTRLS